MNCESEFRNYARSAAPSAQSHKLWLSDMRLASLSGAKIRRLGRLAEGVFDRFRPPPRGSRIMSDKPTLSDMWPRRQARRILREF